MKIISVVAIVLLILDIFLTYCIIGLLKSYDVVITVNGILQVFGILFSISIFVFIAILYKFEKHGIIK